MSNNMHDMLSYQYNLIVKSWENSIKIHYPQYLKEWTDPAEQYHSLLHKWNTRVAAQKINFYELFNNKNSLKILDSGCGSGWLSIDLSKYKEVREIVALDSSEFNLTFLLPKLNDLMGGNIKKISLQRGLFNPLNFEDKYFDIIVMSSAIHHSPNIKETLSEYKRVLKDNGVIILLNETPLTWFQYFKYMWKEFIYINYSHLKRSIKSFHMVSNNGILYDPYLGDTYYSFFHFIKIFEIIDMNYSIIDTGLFPYQSLKNQKYRLTHFILKKKN